MENYHVWINRFLRLFCGLVYCFSELVFADTLQCSGNGIGGGGATRSAPSCEAYGSGWTVKLGAVTDTATYWTCQNGGQNWQGGVCTKQPSVCQEGAAPPNSDDVGQGPYWTANGRMGGKSACMSNGCTATGDNDGGIGVGVGGGAVEYFTYFKNMKQTGASCNYDDTKNNSSSPDTKCGPNEGSYTVNGKTKCVEQGKPNPKNDPKPKTETTTKETQSPDGTKTKTETTTTTQKSGDGTTTTTTTTTTTKTGADGTPMGTETTTEVKKTDEGTKENDDEDDKKLKDFCEKNPQLNICKNSSVSGTCESTTCNGDAITCEALKLQRGNDCELKKDTPEKTLGKQINDKNDPLKNSLPTIENAKQVDLSSLNLNANGWGLGGGCIQDKSISVMGKQVTIPLSSLCEYLLALRYAIMLIAAILSFKIVSGAVLTV